MRFIGKRPNINPVGNSTTFCHAILENAFVMAGREKKLLCLEPAQREP